MRRFAHVAATIAKKLPQHPEATQRHAIMRYGVARKVALLDPEAARVVAAVEARPRSVSRTCQIRRVELR